MQDESTKQPRAWVRNQARRRPQVAGLIGIVVATATLNAPLSAADQLTRSTLQPRSHVVKLASQDPLEQPNDAQVSSTSAEPGLVTPVAAVDLQRYVGLWYEIARIPAWFQSGCARQTTAQYDRRKDGKIDVVNRCLNSNGKVNEARGLARVIDSSTNSRLQVSFVSFLGWRPFWGDYWILALDPDYRWAVIGDPRRRYGWILSRSPQMDAATLALCFEALERNGYKRSSFVFTPQSPQNEAQSLPSTNLIRSPI